ncbi:hypothetical protein PIB30_027071 [Stylosanthes scabra]|uniref:Ubiquitin-like protease family profile domain-containing protein n=1 Tax=Stylosanthes scabra TaxID=79078 RepID=A0ABU6UD66_9FABA|nr:hypothetical protein [Stylosanthes scabra]
MSQNLRRKGSRTRIPLQRQQNEEVNPPERNKRMSKKRKELNAADVSEKMNLRRTPRRTRIPLQRQQNEEVNPPERNKRMSKKRKELNAADVSEKMNLRRTPRRTRIPLQRQQNEEVNPPERNERMSKKKHEVNAEDEQPPLYADVNTEQRNERRSKHRNDVNAAAVEQPNAAAVIQPPQSSELNADAATNVDPQEDGNHEDVPVNPQEGVDAITTAKEITGRDQIHEDVHVTPQDCQIEVVQATSAEEEITKQDLIKSNANVDTAQTHEDVLVTPPECGIEVVKASSAEEELIRIELRNSNTNLVETQVVEAPINKQDSGTQELTLKDWSSKSDPKEDIPSDKEIEEEISKSLKIVVEIGLSKSKLGPSPSFKLCPEIGSQPEEEDQEPQKENEQNLKSKEIQHQDTECNTPKRIIQSRETMLARLYKWATKPTEDNAYERLFNFKGGKEYTAMRYHLMPLGEEAEVDMTIMEIMCILNNMDKNNENILERYGPSDIDAKTGLPHDISTMEDMDPLCYIDANKLKSAPYVFAPVLFAKHWWLYVLDVDNKKFYALDSLNAKSPSSDRNKIGRFASSVLDQIRVRAGATTMFPNKTRAVVSFSLLPKYIPVPRQLNA